MGKILAIDFGKKRIGLAITDSDKIIASPLKTVANKDIFSFLKNFLINEDIECIVLGDPKTKRNHENELIKDLEKFHNKIKNKFKIPVHFIDERFTSKIAYRIILDSNIKKMKRRDKSLVDKVSASLILETYLKKTKQ
tara:strand:+ start:146 stop:559 length:414 start_codon:yes stop_codon:yes gene_type:complete